MGITVEEALRGADREEFEKNFWNAKGGILTPPVVAEDYSDGSAYVIPNESSDDFEEETTKASVMRKICTVMNFYNIAGRMMESEFQDDAAFLSPTDEYPVTQLEDEFDSELIRKCKMGTIMKVHKSFVGDNQLDLGKYLARRLGHVFGRLEDDAFINGSTTKEPAGFLNSIDEDAVIETDSITYEDILSLYFSVNAEFRQNGVWLMNDTTALALKKLKDDSGAYIWRGSDDTIMGHKVYICEFMPDIDEGNMPVAFGDFRYYWILRRSRLSVKALGELYSLEEQIGYKFTKFVDGMLVRKDAINVIRITEEDE